MGDPVEAAQLIFDESRRIDIFAFAGGGKVERQRRRFRQAAASDVVVERIEQADVASVEHNRGAMLRTSHRNRPSDTARGACYQYHPSGKQVRRRVVSGRISYSHVRQSSPHQFV